MQAEVGRDDGAGAEGGEMTYRQDYIQECFDLIAFNRRELIHELETRKPNWRLIASIKQEINALYDDIKIMQALELNETAPTAVEADSKNKQHSLAPAF